MDLIPSSSHLPARRSSVGASRLLEDWLAGRKATTQRAYSGDLRSFATWLEADSPDAAARELLGAHPGDANALALEYRNYLRDERGLAPATINRQLSALRSLVDLAQTLGMVAWSLKVRGLKSRAYRDTRGTGRQGFLQMLRACGDPEAPGTRGARIRRNRAILRLLYDLALRRGEVVSLGLSDVDLAGASVSVLGKGHNERERVSLPGPTGEALAAWLEARGDHEGPLFFRLDNARGGEQEGALTGAAVYQLVRRLGGKGARPHGLRHAAITDALELTGGDVRAVRSFSRHATLRTLTAYDDAREDLGGVVARRLAGAASE